MSEDRRNFLLAQRDPVYSNIKRYISGSYSFGQFLSKISFNDELVESIHWGVDKIRVEGSMLQQVSAECGPKLCLKRFGQVTIRTEPSESEHATTITHVFPIHSLLPFFLLPAVQRDLCACSMAILIYLCSCSQFIQSDICACSRATQSDLCACFWAGEVHRCSCTWANYTIKVLLDKRETEQLLNGIEEVCQKC